MNSLAVELGAELDALDPEDARHIQRALKEMIALARRKPQTQLTRKNSVSYEIQARPLGLKEGLSYDNVAELLTRLEGDDWK
jgi:ribosomal protein L5